MLIISQITLSLNCFMTRLQAPIILQVKTEKLYMQHLIILGIKDTN